MDASDLLRNSLLQLSKQEKIRDVIEKAPVSRSVVKRFVPGAERADVVGAASEISASGRLSTIDYLGEDTTDLAQAQRDGVPEAWLTAARISPVPVCATPTTAPAELMAAWNADENAAALAPTPNASVRTVIAVNPGVPAASLWLPAFTATPTSTARR